MQPWKPDRYASGRPWILCRQPPATENTTARKLQQTGKARMAWLTTTTTTSSTTTRPSILWSVAKWARGLTAQCSCSLPIQRYPSVSRWVAPGVLSLVATGNLWSTINWLWRFALQIENNFINEQTNSLLTILLINPAKAASANHHNSIGNWKSSISKAAAWLYNLKKTYITCRLQIISNDLTTLRRAANANFHPLHSLEMRGRADRLAFLFPDSDWLRCVHL